ncbi:MAG: hypothetical protein ABG776_13275 [Cyanobacteria bacterium J06555_13]
MFSKILTKIVRFYLFGFLAVLGYLFLKMLWDGFRETGWAFFDLGLTWADSYWIFGLCVGFGGCFLLLKLNYWLYKHDPIYRKNTDEDNARQHARDHAKRWK